MAGIAAEGAAMTGRDPYWRGVEQGVILGHLVGAPPLAALMLATGHYESALTFAVLGALAGRMAWIGRRARR